MAQDDPWKEINSADADFVKQFWPRLCGKPLQDNMAKDSPMHNRVCPWPLDDVSLRAAVMHNQYAPCDYFRSCVS